MILGMIPVLILNGPNLNLLGTREPDRYGHESLNDVNARLVNLASELDLKAICYQTNHEGEMIDFIHGSRSGDHAAAGARAAIINAGAWTHTSIALRDAMLAVALPFIEVHISNVYAREGFRKHSYLSDIAQGTICGLGTEGYCAALRALARTLHTTTPTMENEHGYS